ncbi:hypothetical protein BPY_14610 [Bifidobacterium psychraerophilum]|jgi:hypothetical protein|uniref:DUF4190 domain-containing protein n=1 Tax=Bifidobacterium psychraerophilum TaxID=218140 RepID=A0A087CGY9_9BIFI|nr:hypothetical protein [Bifidobacterium psychraerophilum]KFI82539.1 hypothetical protein BPSY_1389 [Bifidobacterium psychraerophilum]MCI1803978.1 hypothetical protein [Bifidobacterium psychraerophilum]MCI2175724.1 hypothetical protein [Bifidobacterium psychraerophilum]MCI2181730.1 hypothetical protein [Bifidobacterium psychraerophilum]
MKSQYPGWNPYVYGEPEVESPKTDQPQGAPTAATAFNRGQAGARPANGQGMQGRQGQPQITGGKGQPRMLNGVNLDDPNQNPVYGRWDPYAIVAFIMTFLTLPVLPAILGGIAIYRTTVFHMKGRGLAIAAVVIAVIELIMMVVMVMMGITTNDLLSMMASWATSTGTGSSISA